ncbi:NmrA family transcriptional regulator [Antribacter gilvus]|uniref:NmrA family transcriptional regulator n=1 Tax=Antribacter gilvus TaxID=2304675 RepID=UPI000F7892BE|nr:NmrA family transcriptional regulator [Antribacter gilvus]
MTTNAPLLVLGGTGTTGRRLTDRLVQAGHDVRVGSRRADPPFEWNDPGTWPAVVAGVRAAYIVYTPDLAFPGAVETVRAFAKVATGAGVGRLVLLSGRGEPEAQRAEAALAEVADAAGATWTVVRCAWFAQNFSETFLLQPVLDGVLALPAGEGAEPFVDADDIADVAFAALTEDGHGGQVYELTGPAALTFREAAGVLSAAIGRPVEYVPASTDEFVAGAVAAGLPEDDPHGLAGIFTLTLDGRNVAPQDGVRRALGREPRPFEEYAATAAAAGAWAVGA